MDERALIVVVGSDSRLRTIAWELLEAGLATLAQRAELADLFLDGPAKKRKMTSGSVGVVLLTKRASVDEALARIGTLARGDEVRAFAVPVLGAVGV